jgi:membrane protein YqaA with SNARE-associated domain
MRGLFSSFFAYFLTPAGLVALGVLDSSLIFFLPLGIDVTLIILAAWRSELFWLYALAATAGSVIGAALTYWIGHTIGEAGLARFIKQSRLKRVQQRVSRSAAAAVAALAVIPPPFPFTAFVLTSGAFKLDRWRFFSTLAAVRLFRFGVEAALAARFGGRLLTWMDSTVFEVVVACIITLAIIGTLISAIAFHRGAHAGRGTV